MHHYQNIVGTDFGVNITVTKNAKGVMSVKYLVSDSRHCPFTSCLLEIRTHP